MAIVASEAPEAPALLAPQGPGFGRAFGRATVFGYQRGVTVPLPGVAVTPYVPGTTTPWPDPLYLDESDTEPARFPVATDATGSVSLWAGDAGRIELVCASPGYGSQRVVVDLEFPPSPDADDPYPQYLTEQEGDALFLTPAEGAALFLPLAHEPGTDPHPQYATDAALATALSDHTAAPDPHPAYATDTDVAALAGVYQALTEKNQAGGYPGLDAGGKVPSSTLPPLAITDVFVVNTEAAMLALTAQRGDFCVRSDVNQTYALAAEPASVLANWVPLMGGGTAAVTSVDGRVGNVVLTDLYAPAAHTTAPDPHAQYTTDAEATTIANGAVGAHAALGDPHAQYSTDADLAAAVARIAALETQVATLNTKLTSHLHQNGTVGQIAGAATFP